ncbi:DNA polymerase III subunit delta [bacterium]|nr:DNA polymerase III subunit delta [bacterium]
MAAVGLAQALRDLENRVAPLYVVSGNEPFQAGEFLEKLRAKLLQAGTEGFNQDVFDAEQVSPVDLLASLDTLPGLFDAPDSIRLVICRRFEKAPAALLERLEGYFQNPAPQTCFLMIAEKIDRRKSWIKDAEKNGVVLEVAEPFDRDWPRWRTFFEKRVGKSIEPQAWDALVEVGNRSLALVSSECQKAALFVGDAREIRVEQVREVCGVSLSEDIFQLSEDIVARRSLAAMLKLHRLTLGGESEIKILSILLRHFRQISQCLGFLESGVNDPKVIGPQIGVPPFFVPKIMELARGYTTASLTRVFKRLADCDYLLKTGEGTLWGDFCLPHFTDR